VKTRSEGDWAVLEISDSGSGMPPHVQQRIFEPFFTTKEVGKGTGQGLAIAHNVIVDKHAGSIKVTSSPGAGTTFTIRLPIGGIKTDADAAAAGAAA
jgi:signal transduction histidine kinase